MVKSFGSGLKNLHLVNAVKGDGVHKKQDGGDLECIGIYCRNCYQWCVCEYGSFYNNYTIVPLYDTLGADGLSVILDEVGFSTIICGDKELTNLINLLETQKHDTLKNIIAIDEISEEMNKKIKDLQLNLYTFNEVLENGKEHRISENEVSLPKREDTALIIYTSGSTGTPKGVVIYHRCLASLAQSSQLHDERTNGRTGDYYISYLPLPHVFEQFIIGNILSAGGAIGFYSGDKRLLMEDIFILKPTIFASVPRIFSRMKDQIEMTVKKTGGFVETMFNKAIAAKQTALDEGYLNHAIYDKLVFSKIKAKLGFDRLRWVVSGSAPLPIDTCRFLRCVFGCPLFEGYGMTESGGGICCGELDDVSRFGSCGGPVHGCEMRLVSIPEKHYSVEDKEHTSNTGTIACDGRGEICLRGFNVTPGYFNRPDLTKETIDEEGWFHTGDIGLWDDKGTIHIIDRKKNILKLSQGEYVAIESLENIYQSSQYVDQIFVYGDSFKSCLVAIVVPDYGTLKLWCKEKGYKEESFQSLCQSEAVKELIQNDLLRVWKEKKLNGIERLAAISIHSNAFTVEDNLLTPTMKLRRTDLSSRYKAEIDQLYEDVKNKK